MSARLTRPSTVVLGASSLFGATVVTSALGFAFWAVAARLAPVAEVGGASAAIALMQLLGSLGTLGLGTLLIGELAKDRTRARGLVLTSVAVAGAAGGLLGAAVGLGLQQLTDSPVPPVATPGALALFAAGTAVTSATGVLDQGLVGLAQHGRQLQRNAVFALSKLVLLPVVAGVVGLDAVLLYAAWTAGNLVSLLVLLRGRPVLPPGARGVGPGLRGLGRQALTHHCMNVAAHAPLLVLPSLVAARLGAAEAAGLAMAVLLSGFAWTVSSHLSTALFSLPPHDTEALRRDLRTSLRISTAVAVVAALGGLVAAGTVLRLFGPEYATARGALVLLLVATAPSAVKGLYIAVRRVQGRLGQAAGWTTAGSALELVAGTAGLLAGGLTGLAAGVLLALLVQSCLYLPPVLAAARQAAAPAPDPQEDARALGRALG